MTLLSASALFMTMLVLAISPGPSAAVVMARGLNGGMRGALLTTLGIVSADYIFIVFAVLGLSAAAQTMGHTFIIIKYAGAAYLAYLGLTMLFNTSNNALRTNQSIINSGKADYIAGLFTTLANPKAIIFYVSFFPAFLDLNQVTLLDVFIVLIIITVVMVPVMLAYAYLAVRSSQALNKKSGLPNIKKLSGALLLGSGIWLGLKTH